VTLSTYGDADELYFARGQDVNNHRPLFTGDVLLSVPIPGVQEEGLGIVIAHPCSIRGAQGRLQDRLLVAAVRSHDPVSRKRWTDGFYALSPLPDLGGHGYCVGHLDRLGRAATIDATATERVACLSEVGINILQERLTFHLTRAAIPRERFQEAFAHTVVEADLLEEWTDTMTASGKSIEEAVQGFEAFLRSGQPSLQEQLLLPERRSFVRRACRKKVGSIIEKC